MAGSNFTSNPGPWPASASTSYPSHLDISGEGSSSGSSNQQPPVVTSWGRNGVEPRDYEHLRVNPGTTNNSIHSRDPTNPAPPQNYTQRQKNLAKGLAACGCQRAHK